jgi:hypothetical protein
MPMDAGWHASYVFARTRHRNAFSPLTALALIDISMREMA